MKYFSVLVGDLEKDNEGLNQRIKKEQEKVAQVLNNNDLLKKENERLKTEMSEEEQKFLADIQAIKKYAETEILFLADYAKKRKKTCEKVENIASLLASQSIMLASFYAFPLLFLIYLYVKTLGWALLPPVFSCYNSLCYSLFCIISASVSIVTSFPCFVFTKCLLDSCNYKAVPIS